jgi:hypothetical protein
VPPSDQGAMVIECCGRRERIKPGESFQGRYA